MHVRQAEETLAKLEGLRPIPEGNDQLQLTCQAKIQRPH